MTVTFAAIVILAAGELPWQFADEPEERPGPWSGESIPAILTAAQLDPAQWQWWDSETEIEGGELWIAPRSQRIEAT